MPGQLARTVAVYPATLVVKVAAGLTEQAEWSIAVAPVMAALVGFVTLVIKSHFEKRALGRSG
jgi:hypothetical protein